MDIQRILCPIDFSEFNQIANRHASILAKSTGARIIYLHVCLPDAYRTPAELVDQKEEEEALRKQLKTYQPTEAGVEASWVLEYGIPAERIIHYANENDIDLVVIGTHGRTGILRVLMGSVAETVVRQAECPVLAIKDHVSADPETES
jgi:universal stress protein A